MLITGCKGMSLEKTSKTSPEDAFNRSVVTYERDGLERQFHLVYVGYYEKRMLESLPYEDEPLFSVNDKDFYLKDVMGILALIQHPDYHDRKRVYIHDQDDFNQLFENVNFKKIEESLTQLVNTGSFNLEHAIPFLNQ